MEKVKKSVNPIVYKSASVRNLPVPVQSFLQLQFSMDPEDPPSETSAEKDYNSILLELAKRKAECDDQLGQLQQKARDLAVRFSGSGSGEGDSGNETSGSSDVGGNHTLAPVVTPGSLNNVTSGRGIFNDTISGGDSHRPAECPVCPDVPSPEECGPCRECPPCEVTPGSGSSGESCHPESPSSGVSSFSGLVDSPASFAVGAAAVLLILAVAVLIGVAIRYIPVILSGIVVLGVVCMVWYYSSRYPEASRRLGSRVWGALSGAAVYIVDRLFGRRHPEVSVNLYELVLEM